MEHLQQIKGLNLGGIFLLLAKQSNGESSLSNLSKKDSLIALTDYDQIAIRFIYMPLIREHVYTFVQVHNTHRIRRQKNREEYLPTGML